MAMAGVHCYISGRVQGVGFRYYTRQAARQLGLSGWVRNRWDGSVELKAFGEQGQLDRLLKWLPDGVPASQVSDIRQIDIPFESNGQFDILSNA